MTWYLYSQQFRQHAVYDLSISGDTVDLGLWTVSFSGEKLALKNLYSWSKLHVLDSVKQTADCGLRTADCEPGVKCRVQTQSKMQTDHKL